MKDVVKPSIMHFRLKSINNIDLPEDIPLIFHKSEYLFILEEEYFVKDFWKEFFYNNKIKKERILNDIFLLSQKCLSDDISNILINNKIRYQYFMVDIDEEKYYIQQD